MSEDEAVFYPGVTTVGMSGTGESFKWSAVQDPTHFGPVYGRSLIDDLAEIRRLTDEVGGLADRFR